MRTGTAPPSTGGFSPSAPFVNPGAPKARRQPALLALGFALVGVSAAGFVWWSGQANQKSSVLVLARDVPYGQRLSADDLKSVEMAVPSGVKAVGTNQEGVALSMVATANLHAGDILSTSDVGGAPPIPAGDSLVAATFDPAILPAGITPGRQVLLIANGLVLDPNAKSGQSSAVPKDQVGILVAGGGARQITYKGTVVIVNDKRITLAVPQDQASIIEELAFEGHLGIVLLQNS